MIDLFFSLQAQHFSNPGEIETLHTKHFDVDMIMNKTR